MPQIGQLLVEYTNWLKDNDYLTHNGDQEGPNNLVETFLTRLGGQAWMPTTGADLEEAEPDPEVGDVVNIAGIVEYCEGVALNPAANAAARLKAAEVIIRWFGVVASNEDDTRDKPSTGPL